jgi:hypothetical protein
MQLVIVDPEVVRDLVHESHVDLVLQILEHLLRQRVALAVENDARKLSEPVVAAAGEVDAVVETEEVERAVLWAIPSVTNTTFLRPSTISSGSRSSLADHQLL